MALDQFAYRFRDHGNASVALSSTSWGVNQSTPFGAVNPARRFRLRVGIAESASSTNAYKLQWNKNGGSWADVAINSPGDSANRTAVDPVEIVANTGYVEQDPTTSLLTGGSGGFVAGDGMDTTITSGSISLSSQYTELEWSLWFHRLEDTGATQFFADGDTINFRVVTSGGTPLGSYTANPSLTVDFPAGYVGGQYSENPQRVGPFEDGNGNLYALTEPTEHNPVFVMWKSTDDGVTWTPTDMAGTPASNDLEGVSVRKAGTQLHIVHWGGNGGTDGVYYHRFAMSDDGTSPDQWVETDTTVDNGGGSGLARRDQAVTHEVLSNGNIVVLYHYDSATAAYRIGMRRRISGTWDTSTTDVWTNTDGDWLGVTSVLDPTNDIVYAFANDDALGNLYGKRITSAGTIQDLFGGSGTGDGTTVATGNSNINIEQNYAPPVFWNDGSDRVYFVYIVEASRRLAGRLITVGSGGSVGSEVLISDASNYVVTDWGLSRQPAAAIARDAATGDLYAFFSRTATSDGGRSNSGTFYYSVSTNDGTSWATDTLLGEAGWGSAAGFIRAEPVTGGFGLWYQNDSWYEQDASVAEANDHGHFGGFVWYDSFILSVLHSGAGIANTAAQAQAVGAVNLTLIYTTGDGTLASVVNEVNATTNLYQSIDDDPTSPTDTDWVNNHLGTTASSFFELTNMPSNFASMREGGVIVRWRGQTFQEAETLYVQLFQSDEATTLSNEMLVATASTDSAFVNTAVVNFTGLDTSSGKAVWDGAKIRLRWA